MILISNFKYPRLSNNKNHLTACSNQRNYETAIVNWTFFLYSVWFLDIILRYFAFVFYRIIPILTLICSSLVTSHWMNVATPGPAAFTSLSRARPAASGVIQKIHLVINFYHKYMHKSEPRQSRILTEVSHIRTWN